MNKNNYLILILAVLVSGCSKTEIETFKATSSDELVCQSTNENCFSPDSFSSFKLIGNDISDNLASLEKVLAKYDFPIENKSKNSISFSNNNYFFEFFISSNSLEFKMRAQKKRSSPLDFMSESASQVIEKIKFDFFQKNY